MKKIILLFLLLTACGGTVRFTVRDTDTKKPVPGVRIVTEKGGNRSVIAITDEQGNAIIPTNLNGALLLFFKNYYRPLRKSPEISKAKKEMIFHMKERRPPNAVSKIKIENLRTKSQISWQPSNSADTGFYSVYMYKGLNDRYQLLKTKLKDTRFVIPLLKRNLDYYFKITATDKNGNENKGVEKHIYISTPPIKLPRTARLSGKVTGNDKSQRYLILYPVNLGVFANYDVSPIKLKCKADGSFISHLLPAGRYTVKAFADSNGNGVWDGYWLNSKGEAIASKNNLNLLKGKTVQITLKLRKPAKGLPQPIFAENPGYLKLYNAAWRFAKEKISKGQVKNGFTHAYMDEGFNNHIYQWDTCFMMFFGMYGGAEFPAMNSVDNFYRKQHANGYICRVQNEDTGGDYKPKKKDPHINPPLFAWVEYKYYQRSGDNSRLLYALHHNDKYFNWIKNNARTKEGYYYISNLGSGMDNSPREGKAHGWIDLTSQMAQFSYYMARLAKAAGLSTLASKYKKEHRNISRLINGKMWDKKTNIYRDITKSGQLHNRKTIASFWSLIARVANSKKAKSLVSHLKNPNEFFTPHLFPTLSKDEPEYDSKGYYWRGGVWAPTTFMVIKGLEAQKFDDFANSASRNHLNNMLAVFEKFKPAKSKLPYGHSNIPFPKELDGTKQIWECYSPEKAEPATRWDNYFYVRPRFVGWSGVGPITLFIENVIGIKTDVPTRTVYWQIRSTKKHGVKNLAFGRARIQLLMTGIKKGRPQLLVKSPVDFRLIIKYNGRKRTLKIRKGRNSY